MRSLPKNLRVHFVPVPDAVARVLPLLERGRRLAARAARRCAAAHRWRAGAARCVPRGPAAAAPAHELRAARRCGQGDRAFAQPRGLREQARRRLAAALREAVAAHHRREDLGVRRSAGAAGRAGRRAQQVGYPALVDEGDSVGLRVFATPAGGAHQPRARQRAAHPPRDGARPQVVAPRPRRSMCRARWSTGRSPRIRC